MKTGLISLVVLMVATVASAAPTLSYSSPVDLGGGLYGVTFGVTGGGPTGSWAVTLTFTSPATAINQIKKGGTLNIHTEVNADTWDGNTSNGVTYLKALDSWVYGDTYAGSDYEVNWTPLTTPYVVAPKTYSIHVGTPGGVSYGDIDLAYIVFNGTLNDTLGTWAGTVSRGGLDYATSGSVMIPEPATMGMLALGGLSFLVRRRRTAK